MSNTLLTAGDVGVFFVMFSVANDMLVLSLNSIVISTNLPLENLPSVYGARSNGRPIPEAGDLNFEFQEICLVPVCCAEVFSGSVDDQFCLGVAAADSIFLLVGWGLGVVLANTPDGVADCELFLCNVYGVRFALLRRLSLC